MLFKNGIKFVRRIDGKQPMSDLILISEGHQESLCLLPTQKRIDQLEIQNAFLEEVKFYNKENLKSINKSHLSKILLTLGHAMISVSVDENSLNLIKSNVENSVVSTIFEGGLSNINLN